MAPQTTSPLLHIGNTFPHNVNLKAVLDSKLVGICLYEWVEGSRVRALYTSPGYAAITGYTEEEYASIAAWDALQHVHPADAEELRKKIHAALHEGTPCTVTYRIHRKDGVGRALRMYGQRVACPDSPNPVILATITDVTQQKINEFKFRETSSRLRKLADYIPGGIGIFELFPDGRVSPCFVNDTLCAMSGYTRREFFAIFKDNTNCIIHPEVNLVTVMTHCIAAWGSM